MKGFIKQTVAGCLSASLVSLVGCSCYRDLVDPCWPQRYNMQASASINEMHGAQADKGHILDQTVWNWYFVTDPKTGVSDVLNGAGIEAAQDHLLAPNRSPTSKSTCRMRKMFLITRPSPPTSWSASAIS